MNDLHTWNNHPLLEGRSQALQLCLLHQVQKEKDGKADRAVDDEPYINERKLSTTTAAKGDSENGPSQKKQMETPTKSWITNYLLTGGSHRA
jgi:hypothetical protein